MELTSSLVHVAFGKAKSVLSRKDKQRVVLNTLEKLYNSQELKIMQKQRKKFGK